MDYTFPYQTYLSTPTSLPISISTQTSSYEEDIRSEERKHNRRRGSNMKLSTDPQSVAARERRHRISDRFKILQSLVPGGSKMDTVSMLEEAIHYVKFLKAQIWMHQTMMGGAVGVGVGMPDNNNTFLVESFPDSSGSCLEGGGLAGDQHQYYNRGFNEVENQPCWGNYGFQGSDQEQMLLSQVPFLDYYLP